MLTLVSNTENQNSLVNLDFESIMEVLKMYLVHSSVNTKVHTLSWIHHLFSEAEFKMSEQAGKENLLPVLLNILNDSSDEVVLEGLTVIADIVKSTKSKSGAEFDEKKYKELLESLLDLFKADKNFLDKRGMLIIKQLCALLNAEYIYRTFAEILFKEEQNSKFVSTMVRKLNSILFTASELFELRSSLRNIQNPRSGSLFECLYKVSSSIESII
jgi:vacuole morphology and inheritance protein 14